MSPRPSPRDLRASDTDRDRVLTMLAEAMSDGRLTADEHAERVQRAIAARTLGELAELTADLAVSSAQPGAAVRDGVRRQAQADRARRGVGGRERAHGAGPQAGRHAAAGRTRRAGDRGPGAGARRRTGRPHAAEEPPLPPLQPELRAQSKL